MTDPASPPPRPPSSPTPSPFTLSTSTPPTSSPSPSPSSSPNAVLSPIPLPPSSRTDPLGFVWDVKANPCFRSSLLWGMGLGAALGVHAGWRGRDWLRGGDVAVKGMVGVSAVMWLWCRYQARQEKELFDRVYARQVQDEGRRRGTGGGGGGGEEVLDGRVGRGMAGVGGGEGALTGGQAG